MAKQTEARRGNQLTVRIPQALREALEAEAARERRSVADIVVYMLEARYPHAIAAQGIAVQPPRHLLTRPLAKKAGSK